ncbi:ABC transporter substrate-binding protein [Gluconacetobacter sp. Hr-1-5]|uniref:ABC transporter substrate-binding protein n=1 Tax=Gluconacetobacter sp. Hr-1-5 TaxID=3395370 RepID=UPI003B5217A0
MHRSFPSSASPPARPVLHRRSLLALSAAGALAAADAALAIMPDRPIRPAAARRPLEQEVEAAPPAVIRFGGPGRSHENQRMWGLLEIARSQGFLESTLRDTPAGAAGVRLDYSGFATPAMVGEALTNGNLDFGGQGELIALLSRRAGSDTSLLMPNSRLENAYLVVPPDSPIRTLADIRNKRIAYSRGRYINIQVLRILADHGMSERDFIPVNMDPATAASMLASHAIDGIFDGSQLALPVRDSGLGRIVYNTRTTPVETAQTGLFARRAFVAHYPQTTLAVVRAMVRAARWASLPQNRPALMESWVYGSRNAARDVAEDLGPGDLIGRTSPLIDPFVLSQYHHTQDLAIGAGLMDGPVDIEAWMDRRFLDRALNDEGLTTYWPRFDAQGVADRPFIPAVAEGGQ